MAHLNVCHLIVNKLLKHNTIELYHASKKEMKIGEHIVSSYSSKYYPEASELMDSTRPYGKPTRVNALYCLDNPEFALYFLMRQNVPFEKINLYKVEVYDFHKAPFAITHEVNNQINKGGNTEALISEYWSPTLKWHFYEFLTLGFKIQEILTPPVVNETIIRVRYGNDFDQAQRIN